MNENEEVVTQETEGQETKTYTQEEVDKLLQSETDRRVTQALKTAKEKSAKEVREAQRLAQMNEEQKYEYELQQREEAIREKEKALALAENKNEASKILAEKGISLKLVDFCVAEDAEEMYDRIKLLDKEFKASVKAEVEKRIGQDAPKAKPMDFEAITKKDFAKMNLMEQNRLAIENPELYKQLTQ